MFNDLNHNYAANGIYWRMFPWNVATRWHWLAANDLENIGWKPMPLCGFR